MKAWNFVGRGDLLPSPGDYLAIDVAGIPILLTHGEQGDIKAFANSLRHWGTPNIILTPHGSSDDDDNYAPLIIDLVFDNIARWYAGKPLRNVVDRDLRY